MTNEETARVFNDTQAYAQSYPDLRDPQVERWLCSRRILVGKPVVCTSYSITNIRSEDCVPDGRNSSQVDTMYRIVTR